jgi:alpha-glucosidase (family GH31 glycosyl hydrolase)
MPWDYDTETEAIWTQMANLHIRAKPLILKLWSDAQTTGLPITRPLWLVFPDDREGYKQDQEFMLGDDVLVAPVVMQGATSRDVYFPQGCWQHGDSGAQFNGPKHQSVDAPLASLPYFFRCGTKPF